MIRNPANRTAATAPRTTITHLNNLLRLLMRAPIYAPASSPGRPFSPGKELSWVAYETEQDHKGGAMTNLLDQLKTMTVVVSDTGDINSIKKFRPRDATTNPSLIAAAAQMPAYAKLVDDALVWAQKSDKAGDAKDATIKRAIDRLAVEFGLKILEIVPGRVSTEVDARLSFDTQGTIAKAHQLIGQYEAAGAKKERILIKIASTWEGIKAAE